MFISFLSLLRRRFLLPFLTILLLSGCSQPLTSQNLSNTPVSIHTGNTPLPTLSPVPVGTSVAFDLSGWIHIQSVSGFTCSASTPSSPPGLLVLPKVQSTYDQGTLQSVKNYVTTLLENPGDLDKFTNHRDTVPYPTFSANPNAFQLIAVSNVNTPCDEILHITNIRNTPVQVTPASVKFTEDTKTNTQHYNTIEGCSLLDLVPGCGGQFGGNEDEYDANFALHPGKANTIIPASIIGGGLANTLTLQPGEVAKVILSYTTSPSGNLSFSFIPSFTIGSPGKQQMLYSVSQLQSTLAFARGSQYSCYSLQGQQFIEVSASQIQNGVWCI